MSALKKGVWVCGAVLPWVAVAACWSTTNSTGVTPIELERGQLNVSTHTTGTSPDPDGYWVKLEEARVLTIDANGAVTFDTLPVGNYPVLLDDIAGNCAVVGDNPATVVVVDFAPAEHPFEIVCS